MKNKLKNELIINLFITLIISFLTFLSNKYFSEYMGVRTLGLMKLFTQIIAYLNLADMGIGVASSYALYKPLSEKNTQKINLVISTIDFFYKRIAIIILVIGLLFSLFLNKFIKNSDYGYYLYFYWILYVVNTSISYIYAKYPILFTANQEFKKVRFIQGSGKIIFQIFQIVFLIKTKSFLIFIIIMILENAYLYFLYKRHYNKNYSIKIVKQIDKNIIKDSKNLLWHKLGMVIVFNTDYIILSKFTSLVIIGIYSSYLMIYQMLITLIGIISNVLTPSIGKFVAENEIDKIYEKWKELYNIYVYISTILIICTYYLINPFMNLWLGKEYILENLSIILILINLFIQMTRGVTETFKTACGFFDDTFAPFLESGLNLFFSLILVQKIGLNGVIIGTIISNIVVILIIKPILVFKRCFNKTSVEYIKILVEYFILTIISILLGEILIKQLLIKKINLSNITSWLDWIMKASILGVIIFIIVSLIFFTKKSFRKILKNMIKNFL